MNGACCAVIYQRPDGEPYPSAATFLTLAGLFAFSLLNLRLLEKGAHHER